MKARWEEETGSQSRRRGEVLFGRKLRAFLGDLSPSFFFFTQVTAFVIISFRKKVNTVTIYIYICLAYFKETNLHLFLVLFYAERCGSFERFYAGHE